MNKGKKIKLIERCYRLIDEKINKFVIKLPTLEEIEQMKMDAMRANKIR